MNDDQLAADIRRTYGRYHLEPRPIQALAGKPSAERVALPTIRMRRLLGGLSLAGTAFAIVLAFALTFGLAPGGTKPESVWAAWQPTPTKPDAAMRAVADPECLTWMNVRSSDRVPGSSLTYGDLPLVTQDQRGPVALFVFGRDSTIFYCLIWPNGQGGYDGEAVSEGSEPEPLVGHIDVIAGLGEAGASPDPAAQYPVVVAIIGRTDAASLVIDRQDGVSVQATVSGGIFAAWWPGTSGASELAAYDGSGDRIQSMTLATPCICEKQPETTDPGN